MNCQFCQEEIGNAQTCPICGRVQQGASMEGVPRSTAMDALGGGGGGEQEKADKEIKDDKTQKGIKSFTKLLKAMKISPQAIALEKIMILLEPFLALIDLLNPGFEYLAGIFEEMLIPVVEALMPVIMGVIGFLDELRPIFLALGEIVGGYITKIISALTPIFEAMGDVVKPFIPLFKELTPLFDMMFEILFPFLPLLELLIPLIKMLIPVIWFIVHGIRALIPYIRMATGAIRDFTSWIKTLADTASSLSGGGGGGGGGGDDDWWPFQTGGLVTRPTKGIVGEAGPEAVIPLPQLKNIIGADTTAEIEVLRNSEITIDLLTEIRDNTVKRRR